MEFKPVALSDLLDHLMLSALWGASFLFMRIAAPEFGAFALVGIRCSIGALTLLGLLWWYGKLKKLNVKMTEGMTVGVLNSAIPFVLLAYASISVASGLLSIVNALVPFWSAFIGWLWLRSSLTHWQSLGLFIGFLGVGLLVMTGSNGVNMGSQKILIPIAAGILATVFYGVAANFAKKFLPNTDPLVNATNSQIGATILLIVPMIIWWPAQPVSFTAWFSAIALGVFCTGLAYVLFFRLIDNIGAPLAVTVVFVVPLFAVFFGAVFLHEPVTITMLFAGLVIVLGSSLALQIIPKRSVTH